MFNVFNLVTHLIFFYQLEYNQNLKQFAFTM